MSVLIKGMELPESCARCRLKYSAFDQDLEFICAASGREIPREKRHEMPSDCPLVELPPHGDLIDRDPLNDRIWKARARYQMMDDTRTADKIMRGLYCAEKLIDEAPSVIAAEDCVRRIVCGR